LYLCYNLNRRNIQKTLIFLKEHLFEMTDNNERRVVIKDPNSIKMNFSGAKYNNRFIVGYKEFKIIVKEQFTKLRIVECVLALLAVGLIVGFSFLYPVYKIYVLLLLIVPAFFMVYLFVNIQIFISKIDPRLRKRKFRLNYDVCFFNKEIIIRTSIHVEKFVFEKDAENDEENTDDIVDTEHLKYSDVTRLVESKQFMYIVTKKRVYLINKKGIFRKRHGDSYDLMRKFVQEKAGIYLYISSYNPTRLYESYYEVAHKLTRNENTTKVLIRVAVIFILIPIFINTIPAVKFSYIWAFWVGLIVCIICLIVLVLLHYQKPGLNSRRKVLLATSLIGIISNLIFGITGTIYASNNLAVNKMRWLEPIINATLPTDYRLHENSHVEKSIDGTTYFRNQIVESYDYSNTSQVESFEGVIAGEDSEWLTELTASQREMLPYDAHTNIGDYYFFYDQIDEQINPDYDQVKDNGEMWYLTYDQDSKFLYAIEYNIFDGVIYTA